MDKEKQKGDWIRLASKSCPGRFYLFNKTNGETQWLPLEHGEGTSERKNKDSTIPKLTISKTPAQDRLKRLQHNLKISQTKAHTSHYKRQASDLKAKTSKEQENQLKGESPSSSSQKYFTKLPKKATKRSLTATTQNETESSKTSALDNPKKLRISDDLKDDSRFISTSMLNDSVTLETSTVVLQSSNESTTNIPENLQNDADNNSKLNNILRCGIVKKIKEICKMPFNMSKKISDEKLFSNDESFSTESRDKKRKPPESKIIKNTLALSAPKNISTPSYTRGSANSRLGRLKQYLLLQQHELHQPCNTKTNSDTLNQISNFVTKTNNNTLTLLSTAHSHHTHHKNSSISSNNTAGSDTTNDAVEAMDWQPILNDYGPGEADSFSAPESTLVIEKSKKLVLQKNNSNESQTIGDIIDTVNENLLRLSAEKQKESADNRKKWRKDFYYFVVDTNVLLRDLTFVEDLSKMKLCNTIGSMVYIPYSVLQELDVLKMRSGSQEGVKTLTVRAIKYLNSKFESNSPNLQAQSALDERLRVVDINSADDSIINCCLQVKEHVPNVLLLTEDVNLRNKAICNKILVSTKSDLMAKRYNSSNKL